MVYDNACMLRRFVNNQQLEFSKADVLRATVVHANLCLLPSQFRAAFALPLCLQMAWVCRTASCRRQFWRFLRITVFRAPHAPNNHHCGRSWGGGVGEHIVASIYEYMYVNKNNGYIYIYIHKFTYLYIYIYIHTYMCVCAYV